MKNLITKFKNVLVIGVAGMMMFSCEMTESFTQVEKGTEAEEMNAGSSFSSSGFGMENARIYADHSFSFIENEDGSLTFTFVPKVNLENARLVFTFAQGVEVDGLGDWSINGATRQKTLNLHAMATYSWTLFLEPDGKGEGQVRADLWTDFTVNGESKKSDLQNILKSFR
ncbi:hypothetical protein [Cecembia calidifontis]|uniref:Lipoprotein n=1 Tax=Cecembia calidifontis TaxID=1187080 RepID=A0A4Q7P769_9BACT|nr:hypothetical protein [Cecembia calidifontis]RZS95963.1 hypothetical protein BC751_1517 [Cecembia calidifontis]